MKKPASTPVIILGGILLFIGCVCLAGLGFGVYGFYQFTRNVNPIELPPVESPFMPPTPEPEADLMRPPLEDIPLDTLELLEQTDVPANDLRGLACRLDGKCNIPLTLDPPAGPRQTGESQRFWVTDTDTNKSFQVSATLRYVTEHTYFWIQDGVKFDDRELERLANEFESKIYPNTRAIFGSEWSPGIDGDEHIYILYTGDVGGGVAGYFSSSDEIHPLAHESSNGHEMFVFSADSVRLNSEYTFGVLAHEFQHMIHWNMDKNEQTWVNEGLSELSALMNGYNPGGFDMVFSLDPDLQLNDWPSGASTSPHYGASFLFFTYFLDRFGAQAVQSLVVQPANGFDGVDQVLAEMNAVDAVTGQPVRADALVLDWMAANFIGDSSAADGRFAYSSYPEAPKVNPTETVSDCPSGPHERTVHQYGADYIEITCRGDFTLSFTGSTQAKLLPADPYSGRYAFWSNKGDESTMTLTRRFDLTGVSGPVGMTYRAWYDIEEDYDYLYVEASLDGQNWELLITPSGTPDDPTGNSFGWAYNGKSGGWIEESLDLSAYAGQQVYIRFEYVTDTAVNDEGFLLDDVAVPAIGYFSDFESDDGGWEAAGFARIQNALPQTFSLALILKGDGGTRVEYLPLAADQTAKIPLSLGGEVDGAVLVVTGTNRFTRELASYRFEVR
ncbi:MAG: hypothetical protein ACOYY3_04475 [Chloroflexota bacterium]